MNRTVLIGLGVLGWLAAVAALGYGGWYTWDNGLIPGNNRAPTVVAMLPAAKRSAELRNHMQRVAACLGPEVGRLQPDRQGRPGIANRSMPGQHAVSFLLEGSPHTQDVRERVLQQYSFLARQGFFTEADLSLDTDAGPRPAKEFRLTWKGFAEQTANHNLCFAAGRREFTRIEKIERVPAEMLGMELWDVSYESTPIDVPDWAQKPDVKAMFPRYAEAVAPRTEKARLMRSKDGWLTEQEMQMQVQLSQMRAAGQDPMNLLAAQMAQAMRPRGAAPDAAAIRTLFDEYLAGEQWQSRSMAACLPLQLRRGGDERGPGAAIDRTSFQATWLDAPATVRRDHERNTMLTQLHILSALAAADLATLEKSGAGTVNNEPVGRGVKFSVKREAIELLGLAGGSCMPVGRIGKVELLGASESAEGSMRLAVRGELTLVQPWAQSLAQWLPALKVMMEEGVPFTGQVQFGPAYDRTSGGTLEAKWHVTGLNPNYPSIQFSEMPAALQVYLPVTTQSAVKLVKAPAILPGLPGVSQPAPVIPATPAPSTPVPAPRQKPRAEAPAAAPATPQAAKHPYPAGSAEVHVVSVYEGKLPGGTRRGFQEHPEGWVDIVVKRTAAPVILFLSAYEPIEWRVRVDGGNLKKVIAIGYYDQRVTVSGARGVEIYTEKSGQFFANARIEVREGFPREGRGNQGLQAAEIINALFGKLPASFQSEYGSTRVFTVDASSPQLVLPKPRSIATAGSGSVVLKSGWKDAIGTLTVQYGGAGAYTEAWASRAYTAGKVYFEAKVRVEGGGPAQPHANVGVAELNSRGQMDSSFDSTTPAIVHGEQNIYKDGDVFGVAVDYDVGVMYVRVNDQWITGEPGSGRGKRFRVGRERAAYLYATGGGGGGGEKRGSVSWEANFGASNFARQLPKGYASYDGSRRN